jgi:hypothetical protein
MKQADTDLLLARAQVGLASFSAYLLAERPDIWAMLVYNQVMKARKRAGNQRYLMENREEISARRKARYALHPFPACARASKWYKGNTERAREAAKQRHQLTLASAPRPRPEVCECCGNEQPGRALSFDHCHDSGQFRGWLCVQCNVGIGALGDNEEGLMRAIIYLRQAKREM